MAQVDDRHPPAPLSAGDRRLLAAAGAALTAFAGLVAYVLGTDSQRPALLAGTIVAVLVVTAIASRWRRAVAPDGQRLHRDDPRRFKSRQERRFWSDS